MDYIQARLKSFLASAQTLGKEKAQWRLHTQIHDPGPNLFDFSASSQPPPYWLPGSESQQPLCSHQAANVPDCC
ncbi:hypothetical protein PM082_023255 [Marasmius tenuissimus]|nr:hypothetical protein PM082_023255 [Marasmius tenuissimus]